VTGPAPAVAATRAAVRACLADLSPPGPEDTSAEPDGLVLVACSGGADSLALAAAAAFVAPRAGLRAGAVVVDHGLQPGSEATAGRAAEQCVQLGLAPVEVVRVEVARAGGPEAAARSARYAALDDVAVRHGAAVVLLGHTLDDQAESVLLGLARGSGARSLAGMAPARGLLRRPFLGLRRSTTHEACRALRLDPWHDPTNLPGDGSPLRSRVRHDVLPVMEDVLGPGVAEALARTADQLRQDADLLDALATELLAGSAVRLPDDDGVCALDAAALASAPEALRLRAVRQAVVAAGCPAGSLASSHLVAVDALVVRWHGQGAVALPGGLEAARRYGTLVVLSRSTRGAARSGCV
jgi:tRNA(Ile)-lysidine synthase